MRIFTILFLLFASPTFAATLQVDVSRNGFDGPIEIALAKRVEGQPPTWLATKTLATATSAVQFPDLAPGLYTVLARGPQPLQRLSAKANVGSSKNTLRLSIPKSKVALRVTLAGEPVAGAIVTLAHDELRWDTEVTTGEDGRFAGALWEPGAYSASVRRDHTTAPHVVDVRLGANPVTIDVPDRHISGRVVDAAGKPIGGAFVALRTEASDSSLTVRTQSAPDGRFEFFGVREGAQSLFARATSYLQSDAVLFELRGAPVNHSVELKLSRGVPRDVRVIDSRGQALANASLFTACDGHVKSTSITDAEGRGSVALPAAGSCAVYAVPKEGSLGFTRVDGPQSLVIRVPAGSSSLKLTLKSEAGDAFSDLWVLMRINGMVVPPAIARQLVARGLSLITNAEGRVTLEHIPPGTYEFWPYRNEAEGRTLYELASDMAAPISVKVLTGENDATVKFRAR
jgi:hypothetical protein